MDDDNKQEQKQEEPQQQPETAQTAEPHGETEKRETDWKAESRKWENRAKENENAALKLAEAEQRAAKAEAALEAANAEAERKRLVSEAAAKHGVSAAVLERMSGATADEIEANASFLHESVPIYRPMRDGGNPAPKAVTRESILAIENERERLKAIAENTELFQ